MISRKFATRVGLFVLIWIFGYSGLSWAVSAYLHGGNVVVGFLTGLALMGFLSIPGLIYFLVSQLVGVSRRRRNTPNG